jgi:hypothetical protein
MLLINLISEEMFYKITSECKTATGIKYAFNICFEDLLSETFHDIGGLRKCLNDLEKRLIRDDVRRKLFGEDN